MSGRKSSEVASVLNSADNIIRDICNNYDNEINKLKNQSEKIINETEEMQKESLSIVFPDCSYSEKEFEEESNDLKNSFKKYKNKIKKINIPDKLQEIEKKQKGVDTSIETTSQNAQNIRNRIKNNPHYCDKEYAEAQTVKTAYENAKKNKNTILLEMHNLYNSISQEYSIQKEALKELKNIQNAMIKLEERAKDIVKIRKEANELKENVQKLFNDIDEKIGKKFKKNEYETAEKLIKNYLSSNDNEVIAKYNSISKEISSLNQNINESYSKWLADKKYTESNINNTKSKLNNTLFIEPLDKFTNQNNSKINIFDYEEKYSKNSTRNEFNEKILNAENFLKQEKFDKANNEIKEAEKIFNKVYNDVLSIEEKTLKILSVTKSLQEVMAKHHFNTHLELIDGSNVANGFKMNCKNGDTIIFDNISIDENNEIKIEFDHQENTSGTCHVRWDNFRKDMIEQGIPMTDVKKDGKSVLFKEHQPKGKGKPEQKQQH